MSGGIVNIGTDESIGELLTVGADILHGSGAGETGDAAQSFDASETATGSKLDDTIPEFAAHDEEADFAPLGGDFGNATHAIDDNDAGETFVATDGIRTVAEDENGEMLETGEIIGVLDIGGGLDLDDITGGAAEAHGGQT